MVEIEGGGVVLPGDTLLGLYESKESRIANARKTLRFTRAIKFIRVTLRILRVVRVCRIPRRLLDMLDVRGLLVESLVFCFGCPNPWGYVKCKTSRKS